MSSSSRVWSVFLAKNGSTGRQWNDGGLRVSREMRVIRNESECDSERNVTTVENGWEILVREVEGEK